MDALLCNLQEEHVLLSSLNIEFLAVKVFSPTTHCIIFGDHFNPVTHTEDVGFHHYYYSMIQRSSKYADDSQVMMWEDCKCTVVCQSDITHSICTNATVASTPIETLINHVQSHKYLQKCNLI